MKRNDNKYVDSLLEFLDNSPCNFLAVDTVKKILTANGFNEKKIDDQMTAKAGDKFFFTKNDSAQNHCRPQRLALLQDQARM